MLYVASVDNPGGTSSDASVARAPTALRSDIAVVAKDDPGKWAPHQARPGDPTRRLGAQAPPPASAAREDAPLMEAHDVWELRWIAEQLPSPATVRWPTSSVDPEPRVIYEHDVYMLTRSEEINLKVRHRENSLKLKTLQERTGDGFERWRTEFDASLPAGAERLRDVLDLIGMAGSPQRLGAAMRAGELVEILEASSDPSPLVVVHKARHLFRIGTCSVDEVRFRTQGGRYRSLGVESSSLADLRSLVHELGLRGSPLNYAQFLADRR